MIQTKMPEMLLIAGNGRNSGKTTLACRIITMISASIPVVAIKITPHFHENFGAGKTLFNREDLVITEESDPESGKDSALMLKAGAVKSYFVMAKDEQLNEALQVILKHVPEKVPVVCESGGLRHIVEPGLFIMMQRKDNNVLKPGVESLKKSANKVITFDGNNIDFDFNTISYSENKWKIIAGK